MQGVCVIFTIGILVQIGQGEIQPCRHGEYLPNSEDCTTFFHCVWGNPVLIKCPETLYFNPERNVCDWPINVSCGNINDGSTIDSTASTTTTSTSSAPESKLPNTSSAPNSTESSEPSCPADYIGLIPDPNSCAHFYDCILGEGLRKLCPNGLHFNALIQMCDWPQEAGCQGPNEEGSGGDGDSGSNDSGETDDGSGDSSNGLWSKKCGKIEHGELTPDLLDCGHYYHCTWGENIRRPCPGKLHFNPILKVCDWPHQAQCNVTILDEAA